MSGASDNALIGDGAARAQRSIDINCDLGESPERLSDGTDFAMLDRVTSANIACGGHAGDEHSMRQMIRAASERGVAVGAHPSFPDRARFGRVEMEVSDAEIERFVGEQVRAFAGIARDTGARVVHVKPHGALYHAAMAKEHVAAAIGRAVLSVDAGLIVVGIAGSPGEMALGLWRRMGLRVAPEAFADRVYEPSGLLRPRTLAGALITEPARAAEQAVEIAMGRGVETSGGRIAVPRTATICFHSDTPEAPAIARAVREAIESAGIKMKSLGE
ncbi:MAG TPA: 5-oxoprolinase subunit PxpA [Phycisphaerales bacterium]|nr:5-oxoprolinase subunit PxpA [Phycisphaerales bacterium]